LAELAVYEKGLNAENRYGRQNLFPATPKKRMNFDGDNATRSSVDYVVVA
jgi:hypothetical protein